MRNAFDLTVMSCPPKYREIGDFYEYYSGVRKAPYLTIFVGGNHEASNYLWELYYGGWVATNIYYMGAASIVRLGPLRIAGMSGIWKGYSYNKSHHERLPYNDDDIKSIYHLRELDVRKLLQVRTQVDICISHDWPRTIEKHGDNRQLFRIKPHFEQESRDGTLGNTAATYVLDRLRPAYWFAAHMHCKFAAVKTYDGEKSVDANGASQAEMKLPTLEITARGVDAAKGIPMEASAHNADEIDLDLDDDDDEPLITRAATNGDTNPSIGQDHANKMVPTSSKPVVSEELRALLPAAFARPTPPTQSLPPGQPFPLSITNKTVRFLALDKCLPGRKFLQLLEIEPISQPVGFSSPSTNQYHLEYDPEWLAITRVFTPSLILGDRNAKSPADMGENYYRSLIEAEEAWVDEHIVKLGKLRIPENFTVTAPVHVAGMPEKVLQGPQEYNNPQMAAFCKLVGIENKFFATDEERAARMANGAPPSESRRDSGFSGGRGRGREGGRGGGSGRGRGFGRGRSRGTGW